MLPSQLCQSYPVTTGPKYMLLRYMQFRVKYITSQILSHKTDLIFTTTKKGGIITTLPSTELRKQELQTPVHRTTQMQVLFPPFSSPYKPISNATSSRRLSYTTPARVSHLPLGAPQQPVCGPAGFFTELTVSLAASPSTWESP